MPGRGRREHRGAGCRLDAHRGHDTPSARRPQHGQPRPVPERRRAVRARAARAAAMQARHVGQHATLAGEHPALRADATHAVRRCPHAWRAAATSARSCSAARSVRLFHVQPARRSARPTVQGWTRTHVCSARRSRHCASAKWLLSPPSRSSSAAATAPVMCGAGPPPMRLALRRPSSRTACAQRYAVERPAANRWAATAELSPAFIAASMRLRMSDEYDPAMDTFAPEYGHRHPNFLAVRSN